MNHKMLMLLGASVGIGMALFSGCGSDSSDDVSVATQIQVGVRPYYLIDKLENETLKTRLKACENMPMKKSDFSIGHRGANMQFPEHSKESYMAAARMGAGVIECDVTFTKDKELVCRHSQCDLHTTTNILATDLASKCSVPPVIDANGQLTNAANIKCCTSDITLSEFKTLYAKMDAANKSATTIEAYMNATPSFRTDLYSNQATLMTHAESIELFKNLNVKMTPELKTPSVTMPYEGMSQEDYAQKMIDEYKNANVDASQVFAQSFNYSDILYWIANDSEFGKQAVYLDGRAYQETAEDAANYANFDPENSDTWAPRTMEQIKADGVNIIAPPTWVLVKLDANNKIVPSLYATKAKAAGLDIITWTLERSGILSKLVESGNEWYYMSTVDAIDNEGDTYEMLDVLAQDVGIKGIFSDWPGTVTYYSTCMGL